MNQIMQTYYPTFRLYQSLRQQLMTLIDDNDLAFRVAGGPTLGELCREMGEVEQAYITSFRTFTLDFAYQHPEANELEGSVTRLIDWYSELDAALETAVSALSNDDITHKLIDRGHDFKIPPNFQLFVYNKAQLIFYGKVSVYLKAMGKELPKQWQDWIG